MTRSRRGRGGHGGGGGGGGGHGGGDSRWLVTYADLLTLLMVLFLVLWVISTIDLKKFEEFKGGLGDFGNPAAQAHDAKNVDTGDTSESTTTTISEETTTTLSSDGTSGEPTTTSTTTVDGATPGSDGGTGGGPAPLSASQLVAEMGQLQGAIDGANLTDIVDVHIDERGLVVSVSTDDVLFTSGSGSLTPSGADIIGSVAPDIADLGNKIIVEGYTDVRPLKRQGYDNWDLSVDRAVSVLKVLRDEFGVAPSRLAATGYGDQNPIATGTDEASLAKNRRVEIVVVAGPDT